MKISLQKTGTGIKSKKFLPEVITSTMEKYTLII